MDIQSKGQIVAKSSHVSLGPNYSINTHEKSVCGDLEEEVLRLRRLLKEKDEEIARLTVTTRSVNYCKLTCESALQDSANKPGSPSSRSSVDGSLHVNLLRNEEIKSNASDEKGSKIKGALNNSNLDGAVDSNIDMEIIYGGEGPSPSDGSVVKIHYTISLDKEKSKIIENSRERNSGSPFEFILGSQGSVIKGWQIALKQMKRGEMSMIKIPSVYGYGIYGLPPIIPENTALWCRIELIDFWKYEETFRPWVVDLQSAVSFI